MTTTQTRYPDKDAVMGKAIGGTFSGWNGTEAHEIVGAIAGGSFKYRSVIHFNIDFSPMISIVSATLTLYEHTAGGTVHTNQTAPPTAVTISRMTADWGEGGADPGEGQLTGTLSWDWDNRFDKFTTNNQVTKNVTMSGNGDPDVFDVTDIVKDWFSGVSNYGFMVRMSTTDEVLARKGVEFYARRTSGDSFRPKLDIVYSSNVAPDAPVLTSPIHGVTINTTTPTLQGTRSDSDTGDYITGVQIQVTTPNTRRYRYSTFATSSDPGSGYFRVNSVISPSALYISETDYDALVNSTWMTGVAGQWVTIYNDSGQPWMRLVLGSVTDNGTWRTIGLSGSTIYVANQPSNDDIVLIEFDPSFLMDSGTTMWDSGAISVAGTQPTFSVIYGSQGTAATLSAATQYKWRAKTKDSGNLWGPYSEYEFFRCNTVPNTPTLTFAQSPKTDIQTQTPTFNITHVDADPLDTKMYGYQIVVEKESSLGASDWSTSGGWDSGQVDTSGSLATTKTVTSSSLAWGGSYRVKARTKDSSGAWSAYSVAQAFQTHKTGTAINLSPSNNENVTLTPTFTGQRASSVDVINAFSIKVWDSTVTSTLLNARYTTGTDGDTFSKLYAGSALTPSFQYKWQVQLESSVGGVGDWSALQTFTAADATTPTISSPAGTGIASVTPTITASRASTFNRTRYFIYLASNTSTPLYSSGTLSAGITGSGPYVFSATSAYTHSWATSYKIKVEVSSDSGSTWSSSAWSSYTTSSAAVPSLTEVDTGIAQTSLAWITNTTPTFKITRGGSDTIDKLRIRVLASDGVTQIWDSGYVDVTNATTATMTYAGPALIPGTTYKWTASYQNTVGPTSPEATPASFRLNGPPTTPTQLFPPQGYSFSTGDDYIFRANFNDPDIATMGDTPSLWSLIVQEADGSPVYTYNVSSGLLTGLNETIWGGTALSSNVDYEWRSRFFDSKGAAGAYSAWTPFRIATPPNAVIDVPSNGSNIGSASPYVEWTYTGGTQRRFRLTTDRTDENGTSLNSQKFQTNWIFSTQTGYDIPAGHINDGRYYNITLEVESTDMLMDPSPSTVNVFAEFDAPDPVTGLTADTDPNRSLVQLSWDKSVMKTSNDIFVSYNIYKKLPNDSDWEFVDSVYNINKLSYNEWYAGHTLTYKYRLTCTAKRSTVGLYLESPDADDGSNITTVKLEADDWMFIGEDRDDSHIMVLLTDEESHNRPVQQEAFETLGSDRKVIIRGFVLGYEGSLKTIWVNEEVPLFEDEQTLYNHTILGRRIVDYLTYNAGPHILKSPFGDVWDVEFSSPTYNWTEGGHLEVNLEWIETGQTSRFTI